MKMDCFGKNIPWKVYGAHTMATWGDNMWWFAGGLFMLKLDNGSSLQLTAVYGLVLAATVILLGSTIGNWIDNTRRIVAARTFLAVQNLSVAIAASILSGYLVHLNKNATNSTEDSKSPEGEDSVAKWSVVVASIALCAVAKLASAGTVILIQRDWIVVIANGDKDNLAKMNSVLRTIELTTYMVAPIVVGQLFHFAGYIFTGFFIAGWNVVSVALEYLLLNSIYREYPKLDRKRSPDTSDVESEEEDHLNKSGGKDQNMNNIGGAGSTDSGVSGFLKDAARGWKIYWNHPVRNAGIGLALLYMTVLGFDNITYSYIIMQNISEALLGGIVAVSALVGVLGSTAYPVLRKALGLEATGFLGMFLLVSMTSLSVASVFLPTSPFWNNFDLGADLNEALKGQGYTSVIVLLTGITAARFGLWIVDLSVTQILQERVEESRRGAVNGVQDSLNNSLDLLKCVLVICLPKPQHFGILIFLSFASISAGWAFYTTYFCNNRGKQIDFDNRDCEPPKPIIKTTEYQPVLKDVQQPALEPKQLSV